MTEYPKVNYDKEVDILYIQLRKAKVLNSEQLSVDIIEDYDLDDSTIISVGQTVGIEILNFSKYLK